MKIRLSSLFLLLVFVSVALAWYVSSNARTSIVGTWRYPTKDIIGTGDYSTLTLRSDGTFLNTRGNRKLVIEFSGHYSLDRSGVVVFTVSKKSNTWLSVIQPDEVIDPEESHTFRYAVSDDGFLLLSLVDSTLPIGIFDDEEVEGSGIIWRSIYQPE